MLSIQELIDMNTEDGFVIDVETTIQDILDDGNEPVIQAVRRGKEIAYGFAPSNEQERLGFYLGIVSWLNDNEIDNYQEAHLLASDQVMMKSFVHHMEGMGWPGINNGELTDRVMEGLRTASIESCERGIAYAEKCFNRAKVIMITNIRRFTDLQTRGLSVNELWDYHLAVNDIETEVHDADDIEDEFSFLSDLSVVNIGHLDGLLQEDELRDALYICRYQEVIFSHMRYAVRLEEERRAAADDDAYLDPIELEHNVEDELQQLQRMKEDIELRMRIPEYHELHKQRYLLGNELKDAIDRQDYERAAELRDRIAPMEIQLKALRDSDIEF